MGRIPSTGGSDSGPKFTFSRSTDPTTDDTVIVKEGDTWYVTGTDTSHSFDQGDAAVYDGAAWREYTVANHDELAGITENAHHNKPGLSFDRIHHSYTGLTAGMETIYTETFSGAYVAGFILEPGTSGDYHDVVAQLTFNFTDGGSQSESFSTQTSDQTPKHYDVVTIPWGIYGKEVDSIDFDADIYDSNDDAKSLSWEVRTYNLS